MVALHQGNLLKQGNYGSINMKTFLHCQTQHCPRKSDINGACGQCARVLSMKNEIKL